MTAPQDMLQLAQSALKNAYCPYSNFPVAACIRTKSGELFSGCNVENAAYPVGHCAETSAVGAMITAGEKEIEEVLVLIPGKDAS